MTPLPVNMIPIAARALGPAGFVVAVLVGLALFASRKASQQQTPPR
jgi:hypothetical protein